MPNLSNSIMTRLNFFLKEELSIAVNLNDVKTPGIFKQRANGHITLVNNYPRATDYGVLYVDRLNVQNALYTRQIWTTLNGRTWTRFHTASSNTWSSWFGDTAGQVLLVDIRNTGLNTHAFFSLANYPQNYPDGWVTIRGWAGGGSGGAANLGPIGSGDTAIAVGGGGGGYFEMSIPLAFFAINATISRKAGSGGAAVTRGTQGETVGNYGRSSQVYFTGPDGGLIILTAVGGQGGNATNTNGITTMSGGKGGGSIILPAGNWTENSNYDTNIDHAQFTGDFHRLFGGTQGFGFIGGVGQNIVPGVNGGGGGGSAIRVSDAFATGIAAKSLNGGAGGAGATSLAGAIGGTGQARGGGGGGAISSGGTAVSGAGGNGEVQIIIHKGGYISPINFHSFTPLWTP
jgi:hypothetical protein